MSIYRSLSISLYLSISFCMSLSLYITLYIYLSIYFYLSRSGSMLVCMNMCICIMCTSFYIYIYIYIIHDCIFFYLCNPYRLRGLFGDLDAGRWTRRTRRLRWHEKGIRRIRRSTIVAHLCPIRNKPRVKCFGRLAFCYQLLITHIGA